MQFKQIILIAVIEAAKIKAAGNVRWMRAIEKAAAAILAGQMIITEHVGYCLITTENGTYRVNGVCECKAAQSGDAVCYHRAGKRLISLYNEMEATAPVAPISPD